MEEFKIISLPTPDEDDNKDDKEKISLKKVDNNYQPPKKRYLFLLLLILFVVIAFVVLKIITTYSDYEVESSWERDDASESKYVYLANNVIKYSTDGASYTSISGDLIWNYTYDMTNPSLDTCENYAIVFDKKGNEVDIFSLTGHVGTINSTIPIIDAKVASQGTVALLLQENNVSYIQLYDSSSTLLASGEIHPENRGYPVSIALSSDATRLLLSVVNINQGYIASDLIFYDFTSEGKKEDDNIIASYSYLDILIPKVDFVKGNKAIAIADNELIIFNNNSKATLEKEIIIDNEMKNVFYNDSYVGYVCEVATEDGEIVNQMNVYNLYGFRCLSKEILESYETISMMENNEILLNSDGSISIYNLQGFNKFSSDFDENIYSVIPGNTSRRYYLIEETKTEEIHIK